MAERKKHVVVIGGGISGASAAHELTRLGYKVTIVEQRDRLGGRIRSHDVEGTAVEMGAGFLTMGYKNLVTFLRQADLERLLYPQKSRTGIYKDGAVRMLSLGNLLGDTLLSWKSKFHTVPLLVKTFGNWQRLDLHDFWGSDRLDTASVAGMFRTRSGKDFMETALQPILNGYFYWSPEHTSQAMMLILCRAAFSHGTYRLQGGLQQIPEAAAANSTVLLSHSVREVVRSTGGGYTIAVDDDKKTKSIVADGVLCATTASAVPRIISGLNERQKEFFGAINYSSAAVIARTYHAARTKGDVSIAFPRTQGIDLAATTMSTESGQDGERYTTIKIYASGATAAERITLTDQELADRLTADMQPVKQNMLTGDPEPVATYIQRWSEALPYFDVGHIKRLAEFHDGQIEDSDQLIAFAGDYLGGPFMEGAFTSGLQAAQRLDGRLRSLPDLRKH